MNQPPSPPEPGAGLTFSSVMDLLLDAICVVDVQGRYLFVSAAFEHIFGYAPEEVIGRPMIGLVHPDDRERTLQAADEIMAGQPKPHFQNRYVRKDGRVIHIMWSARWSEADRVRIAVARDVTELKHAERMQAALHAISEAAHSAEDLLELFRHIHRIVGELLPANNFFVALYDADKDELSFPYFVDEHDPPPPTQSLDSGTLSSEVIRSGQALLLTPEARMELPPRVRPIVGRDSLEWLGVPLGGPQGVIGALVVQSYSGELRYNEQDKALLQFVSTQIAAAIERKKSATRLQYLAQHDQLTSLPNRGLFHDRLRTALARARRDRQQLAVLYLDLDRFKPVNDHRGHDVGDLLLREVAARIRHCVRESDTVGRIGGDEFVVLLNDAGHADHAVAVAAKIGAALRQPFELAGGRLQVSASIGIALYPAHGEDARQLLRRADDAMYDAKRQGGDQARISGTP
ncbi:MULTISPECIES: sensor domain-containing protein [Rhodanobacter]|uniref:sensor domain-containing protein n=1 Tax=Rhodanobacter TaxID=75309 RepID=UPI0004203108|nr:MULTISPECIES: GGDEF domain-containing protein [Rhodanobacter]KZC20023.1 diguanylate cyclase [Rhodanobacter denitrificans]UJJ49760.1 diguanylate cyclase [Rhodanobacter denitrificans]UJJ58048.1 diguanylate cyclase [Rhodanobacter denitrificans]UJM92473.1 diguanylate cyclase [Rhodanobacter denitrificans]UJM96003.1 diguanylate cyclase [Rhodanobacter denitrificans]